MTLGTGIAVAGMWIFAAIAGLSPYVKGAGFLLSVLAALGGTYLVLH
jgi:hypothetical protein